MPEVEKIALYDLDGVFVDYESVMNRDYNLIKSPEELPYCSLKEEKELPYVKERIKLIRSKEGWWKNLPELKLGFDVLKIGIELGFDIHIATKGPLSAKNSWTEKTIWFEEHIKPLAPNSKITVPQDKGLLYGTVFVEDYPKNIERWLTWRPRGIVIMPAQPSNEGYTHTNVTRYNGRNIEEVIERMT